MNYSAEEKLHDCIGNIDDSILDEAETSDLAIIKNAKRNRIAKYSAVSAASAVVPIGLVIAFMKIKSKRLAVSA